MQLFADGVLAGAYRGGRADLATTLYHAVSDTNFHIGRLKRHAGQALCNPTLDVSGQRLAPSLIDCPRCRDIAVRLFPVCLR